MVSYQYANKVSLGIFWDLTIRLDVEWNSAFWVVSELILKRNHASFPLKTLIVKTCKNYQQLSFGDVLTVETPRNG